MSIAPTEGDRRRFDRHIQSRILWKEIGMINLDSFDQQVAAKTVTFTDPAAREFFTTTAASHRRMVEEEKARMLFSERPLSGFPLEIKRHLDLIGAIIGDDSDKLRFYLLWEAIETKLPKDATEEEKLRLERVKTSL